MRFIIPALRLLLFASPIAILAVLRLKDSQRWTVRVLAKRWRAASQDIRDSVVILGIRWVGSALIGLSLVLIAFGADAISLLVRRPDLRRNYRPVEDSINRVSESPLQLLFAWCWHWAVAGWPAGARADVENLRPLRGCALVLISARQMGCRVHERT